MYETHLSEFAGQSVIDFDAADDWRGPDKAYRVRAEYQDTRTILDRIRELVDQPGAADLSNLVIGAWEDAYESGGSEKVVHTLVSVSNRLPKLRALFFGDIVYEECELSWIRQCDVSPVLTAFPGLERFVVRGADGLKFSPVRHDPLSHLSIESGGLPRSVIRELFRCDFPNLEHLELLLGEENYGFDGGVEDLQPLLAGGLYPKLKYLGLMNSELADEIAAVVVNSPILKRVETLDLSMGNLSDVGAKSLLNIPAGGSLKRLRLIHHYVSQSAIDDLRNRLPLELDELRSEEADEEWRPILHAE